MESLHNILSSLHSDHVALRSQVSLSRRFLAVLVFLLMCQLVLCVYFKFLIYQYIKCLNVADIAFQQVITKWLLYLTLWQILKVWLVCLLWNIVVERFECIGHTFLYDNFFFFFLSLSLLWLLFVSTICLKTTVFSESYNRQCAIIFSKNLICLLFVPVFH